MMPDIFSSFDPISFNTFSPTNSVFLIINVLLIFVLQTSFWTGTNQLISYKSPIKSTIFTQLTRTFSVSTKGLTSIVSSVFVIIIMINLMGLFPYMFSTSSHLIFTLTLGFPIWLSLIMSSFLYSPKKSVAHFLPDGAPDWLNPFLVIIETTSVLVRPLTLSFRLAANMSAGHIVLGLVGIYTSAAWFSSYSNLIILTSISISYILFEVAICLIQAYIFCLLLSLYSDDHSH
uniref:ATP synthase subunit a n=1 Tax=Drawida japonica TaxID=408826 RepID=A0A0N6YTX4_9ANNE|nr:ATP synthase F0 subunit 6 [Drawida japonica]AIR76349.1 ATP synthase F0 subunit 6 [Drawida japonica]